jgi:hypothetical protein
MVKGTAEPEVPEVTAKVTAKVKGTAEQEVLAKEAATVTASARDPGTA